MRPYHDPPQPRFKRPGRTTRVRNSASQNFVFATTSPALERAATIAAAAREHNIRQLPVLITKESSECQRLLEELAAKKAEERERERARRLQVEHDAMDVLNALAHCWRRKKFRKRYYKRKSVTRLQSKFRGNIARKKFVRNVMCRKIQARHRGKMDRRRALAWKMKVSKATITIQCAYRCRMAREVAKNIVPLHKRIELKHTRRMAILIIQQWWVKRKWQLLHSDEFRKKVRRRKKRLKNRAHRLDLEAAKSNLSTLKMQQELSITNNVGLSDEFIVTNDDGAVVGLNGPTCAGIEVGNITCDSDSTRAKKEQDAINGVIAQQNNNTSLVVKKEGKKNHTSLVAKKEEKIISASSTSSTSSISPTSSFAANSLVEGASCSSLTTTKSGWNFAELPPDFEKHRNHYRAFFHRQRKDVSKILLKYDQEVWEREAAS